MIGAVFRPLPLERQPGENQGRSNMKPCPARGLRATGFLLVEFEC